MTDIYFSSYLELWIIRTCISALIWLGWEVVENFGIGLVIGKHGICKLRRVGRRENFELIAWRRLKFKFHARSKIDGKFKFEFLN